jgi:hypothetical protein
MIISRVFDKIFYHRHNKGHAFSGFFEPLIQTLVCIAQNDRIEVNNNKTKKQ